MDEHFNRSFDDEDLYDSIVEKYEEMLKNGQNYFFDVEDFESLFYHYSNKGDQKQADIIIENAVSQHPDSNEILMLQVENALRDEKFDKALRIVDRVAETEPFSSDIQLNRANVLISCEKYDLAVDAFYKGFNLIHEDTEKAESLLEFAFALTTSDQYDKAEHFLIKALKYKDYEQEVLSELIFVFECNDKIEGGIDFLAKYIDENPYSFSAWFNLGMIYQNNQRYSEAAFAYDFCLAINPEAGNAYFSKGLCLNSLKDYDNAVETFKEGLKYEPGQESEYCQVIGDIYAKTGNYYMAEKYYLKACRNGGQFLIKEILSNTLIDLSKVIALQNRINEAVHFAEKAVKTAPKYSPALLNLADTYAKIQNPEAEKYYKEALAYDSNFKEVWLNYADFLYNQGRENECFDLLVKAKDSLHEHSEIYYRFAAYLFKSGLIDDAYDILITALEMDPEAVSVFLDEAPEAEKVESFMELLEDYNR